MFRSDAYILLRTALFFRGIPQMEMPICRCIPLLLREFYGMIAAATTPGDLSGQMEIFLYGIFRYSEPYSDINTPDILSRQYPELAIHCLATSYTKNPILSENSKPRSDFSTLGSPSSDVCIFYGGTPVFEIFSCRPILGLYNSAEITILVW